MVELPPELVAESISPRELVLPYMLALRAVDLLEAQGAHILGWDGWLKYPDGTQGASGRHQGTVSLDGLSKSEAAAVARRTIESDHREWLAEPEASGAELYFCITWDAA